MYYILLRTLWNIWGSTVNSKIRSTFDLRKFSYKCKCKKILVYLRSEKYFFLFYSLHRKIYFVSRPVKYAARFLDVTVTFCIFFLIMVVLKPAINFFFSLYIFLQIYNICISLCFLDLSLNLSNLTKEQHH